jgi:hypothetical protein
MNKNIVKTIAVVMLGVSGAAATRQWPERATAIHMALYSLILIIALLSAFWPDRHHPKYIVAMSLALIIHVVILYAIRSLFPFRTILMILPIVLVEFIVLAAVIIKVRGERDAGRSALSPRQ